MKTIALVKGLQTELNKQFNKWLVIDEIFGNLTNNDSVIGAFDVFNG